MTNIIKKTIPQFKKQLQGFLTDESGKVTKEDVLKLALGVMMLWSMIHDVSAICSTSSVSTSSTFWTTTGVASTVTNNDLPPNITNFAECFAWWNTPYTTLNGTIYTDIWVAPYSYSATVNGHANGWGNATILGWWFNGGSLTTVASHGSHGSHGSHSQW